MEIRWIVDTPEEGRMLFWFRLEAGDDDQSGAREPTEEDMRRYEAAFKKEIRGQGWRIVRRLEPWEPDPPEFADD